MAQSTDEAALTRIPAVGSTRAEQLTAAGYETVDSVADATQEELAAVRGISEPMAPCIREGAKELRGDPDTIEAAIAEKGEVDRAEVADAFGQIAHLSGTLEQKGAALEELYADDAEGSILRLEDVSLTFPYLLHQAGYRDLEAVATASLDELAAISYFGQERADTFKRAAQEALYGDPAVEETTPPTTGERVDGRVTAEDAHALLREGIGDDARFRPYQWEAIDRLVNERAQLLLVQRTGWGKSTVYFIATRLLRARGAGPTLIISPLLALMRNQLLNAQMQLGLEAHTINSNNHSEWDEAKDAVTDGSCDVLLISPERLANPQFRREVIEEMVQEFGMLVVDEAHCISDWGHDFRPDYRRIRRILANLPGGIPVAATTATANDRVVEDITDQVPDIEVIRGTLVRDSLRIQTIELGTRVRRLAWLAENFPDQEVAGIVYCLTRDDVRRVTGWLTEQGHDVIAYHGRLDADQRELVEQRLLANEVDAVVSTNALGMGYDKPDLGFVIHFQRPPNLIRYYQEIGRAGRQLDEAFAILLAGEEDDRIAKSFIRNAMPKEAVFEQILRAVTEHDGPLRRRAIQRGVYAPRRGVDQALSILLVEGALERDHEGFTRGEHTWSFNRERYERLTALRRDELAEINGFVTTDRCLTRYIDDALDGDLDEPCGRCATCAGDFVPTEVIDESLMAEALKHFKTAGAEEIEPRKRRYIKGGGQRPIPEADRPEPGRVLAVWDDPGWGRLVRRGKYEDGRFDDALVAAAADLIATRWAPEPAPMWLCAVPSTTAAGVVSDLAARVGRRLDLPFIDCLKKVRDTPPQKEMPGVFQQCYNVTDAFAVSDDVRQTPVLLVDDVVGSRWTLTEAAVTLRRAGSGPVYPFALARRRGG